MKLDDKDIDHLAYCIVHWAMIVDRDDYEEPDGDSCALCHAYDGDNVWGAECCDKEGRRCPIYRAMGQAYCDGTPFHEARKEWLLDKGDLATAEWPTPDVTARTKMRDFLLNLMKMDQKLGEYYNECEEFPELCDDSEPLDDDWED